MLTLFLEDSLPPLVASTLLRVGGKNNLLGPLCFFSVCSVTPWWSFLLGKFNTETLRTRRFTES